MKPIVTYIKAGEKHKQTQSVGMEIEHFILNKKDGRPMSYDKIAALLATIKDRYSNIVYEKEYVVSLENDTTLITLEPGCQLELSFKYSTNLKWISEQYEKAMMPVRQFAESQGYHIVYSGGLPTISADQVTRIDKQRYYYMEKYFEKTGKRGHEMMKATAAVHASIDYADEEDFIKKYRMANILHPLFAFISFNTPVYAGHENKDILLRNSIWEHTDPQRCGIVPTLFSCDFGYRSYAEYVENTPLILMNDHGTFVSTGNQTCKEAADTFGWDEQNIEHYVSMVFPDIRVKQFIEIRSADSMPPKYMIAYSGLIQGLFYNEELIDKYSKLTRSIDDIKDAKRAIREQDWNAEIYGRPICELLTEMVADANNQIKEDVLGPFVDLIQSKKHIQKQDLQ